MKAVDFIKEFGWDYTVNYADYAVNINDLKQYVDAYGLVQSYGGLHGFKTYCNGDFSDQDLKAIQLVEEVGSE